MQILTQLVAVTVFCGGAGALIRGATATFFGLVVVVPININDDTGVEMREEADKWAVHLRALIKAGQGILGVTLRVIL
jgi:hypothetical protein